MNMTAQVASFCLSAFLLPWILTSTLLAAPRPPVIPSKDWGNVLVSSDRKNGRMIRYRFYRGKSIPVLSFDESWKEANSEEGNWSRDKEYGRARKRRFPLPSFDCDGTFQEEHKWERVPGARIWQIGMGQKVRIERDPKTGEHSLFLAQPFQASLTQRRYYAARVHGAVSFKPRRLILEEQPLIPGKKLEDYVWKGLPPRPKVEEKTGLQLSLRFDPDPVGLDETKAVPVRFEVLLADGKGNPVPGKDLRFDAVHRGTLHPTKGVTDGQGRARFRFDTPPAKELPAWLGHDVTQDFSVNADGGRISKTRTLTMRRPGGLEISVRHPVLPIGPGMGNTIRIRLAGRTGSTVKARLRVESPHGSLHASLPRRELEIDVPVGGSCDVPYRWKGPKRLAAPVEECVTVELPGLELKKELRFSVGVDLALVGVQRRSRGPVFPHLPDEIRIWVEDRFHPRGYGPWSDDALAGAGPATEGYLAKLVEAFPKLRPTVTWQVTKCDPLPPGPLAGRLLQSFVRSLGASGNPDVICNDVYGGRFRHEDGRWAVIHDGGARSAHGAAHPAHVFLRRGRFELEATLKASPLDSNLENQRRSLGPIDVERPSSFAAEAMEEVFLPCTEFLLMNVANLPGTAATRAFQLGMVGIDMSVQALDLLKGKKKITAAEIYVCCANAFFAMGPTGSFGQKAMTLGAHVATLANLGGNLFDALAGGDTGLRKGALPWGGLVPAAYGAPSAIPDHAAEEVLHRSLQAARDYNMVVLELDGLAGCQAWDARKRPLEAKTFGPMKGSRSRSLFLRGRRFAVLPFPRTPGDGIRLHLEGNGRPGRILVARPDGIDFHPYPSEPWNSLIEVEMAGRLLHREGSALERGGSFTASGGEREAVSPSAHLVERFDALDETRWQAWAMGEGRSDALSVKDGNLVFDHEGGRGRNVQGLIYRKTDVHPSSGTMQLLQARVDMKTLRVGTELLVALLPEPCVPSGSGTIRDPEDMDCPILHVDAAGARITMPRAGAAGKGRDGVVQASFPAIAEGCSMVMAEGSDGPGSLRVLLLDDDLKILGTAEGRLAQGWSADRPWYPCLWSQGATEGARVFARVSRLETATITPQQFRTLTSGH